MYCSRQYYGADELLLSPGTGNGKEANIWILMVACNWLPAHISCGVPPDTENIGHPLSPPRSRPPHPVSHYVVISGQHNYNLPFTYMQTNMPISLFTEAQNIHNKQALTIEAAIDIYRYILVEGLINRSLYKSKFRTREKRR